MTQKQMMEALLNKVADQAAEIALLKRSKELAEKRSDQWEQRALKAEGVTDNRTFTKSITLLRRYHALLYARTLYDAGGICYQKIPGEAALRLNIETFEFLQGLGFDMPKESWNQLGEREQQEIAAANGTGGAHGPD